MPHSPVVVHFGEAQILKREVTQALERMVHRDFPISHAFEQVLQLPGIHRLAQQPRGLHLLKW